MGDMVKKYRYAGEDTPIEIRNPSPETFTVTIENHTLTARIEPISAQRLKLEHQGNIFTVYAIPKDGGYQIFLDGHVFTILPRDSGKTGVKEAGPVRQETFGDNLIEAPMPGRILKLFVREGQRVAAEERLFILEAMKMENEVRAPRAGVIKKIHFGENQLVSLGQTVIEMVFLESDDDS